MRKHGLPGRPRQNWSPLLLVDLMVQYVGDTYEKRVAICPLCHHAWVVRALQFPKKCPKCKAVFYRIELAWIRECIVKVDVYKRDTAKDDWYLYKASETL